MLMYDCFVIFCVGMEKYHSNSRFAPFRDAPFALRGKRFSVIWYAICPSDVVT